MSEATPQAPTVRARRVEVVDDEGRLRAVLGEVARPAQQAPSFGLVLYDEHGRARLWAAVEDTGPVLVLDQDGNVGVEVGVHDPNDDTDHVGAYIVLNDADGTPAAGWRVEADGTVVPYPEE